MGTKGSKATGLAREITEGTVDILSRIGDVSSKAMFGGHGVFEDGKMFGLVNSSGQVYLKVGESNKKMFVNGGSTQHGKMPYFSVPEDVLDDATKFRRWAKAAVKVAHEA